MGPLFIIIIALGFVALMLGIALFVNSRKDISKKETAMKFVEASSEGSAALLKSYMAKVTDKSAKIMTYEKKLGAELFKSMLIETFESALHVIQQECWIPRGEGRMPTCNTIYGIDTPKGPILIYASEYTNTYRNNKRKLPNYTFKNGNEDLEYYVINNEFHSYEDLKVAIPVIMSSDDVLYQNLMAILNVVELEEIYEEVEESTSSIQFFSLTKSKDSYSLIPQRREIKPIRKNVLSASYNDVTISYAEEEVAIPMGDAVEIMNIALKNNENIFIFGSIGSGKSFLSDELARRVSMKSRTAVVFIPPGTVNELQKVDVLPNLISEVNELRESYGMSNVLFVIDEAEQLLIAPENGVHSITNSFMLSMLNGQIQKLLNCACLLTFNCPPDKLNKAAFRDQRMGMMVELTDLSKEKASILSEILREENPTLIFDEGYWKKLQQTTVISLASVYKCFVTPSKQRIIIDIIRKVRPDLIKEIPIETRSVPTPSAIKVQTIEAPKASIKIAVPVQDVEVVTQQSNRNDKKHHGKNKYWRGGGNKHAHNR